MVGVVFGLLAATCWGFSAIFVRMGLQYLRPTTGTWVSLIPGGVIVMGLAVVFNLDDITTLATIAFFWFALGGLFNFALGRFLNAVSIQQAGRGGPSHATVQHRPSFCHHTGHNLLGGDDHSLASAGYFDHRQRHCTHNE